MIVHIVMWRIKDADRHAKAEKALKIKHLLESLRDLVPQIDVLHVGVNVVETEHSSDIVLYSQFKDLEALDAYQKHPEHIKVAAQVGPLFSERRMVDFALDG